MQTALETLYFVKYFSSGLNLIVEINSCQTKFLSSPRYFQDQDELRITSPTEISNSFIHYFSNIGLIVTNIGHQLASTIPNSHKSFEYYIKNSLLHPVTLSSVAAHEVYCCLQYLGLLNIHTAQDMTRLTQKLLSLPFLLLLMSWHQ